MLPSPILQSNSFTGGQKRELKCASYETLLRKYIWKHTVEAYTFQTSLVRSLKKHYEKFASLKLKVTLYSLIGRNCFTWIFWTLICYFIKTLNISTLLALCLFEFICLFRWLKHFVWWIWTTIQLTNTFNHDVWRKQTSENNCQTILHKSRDSTIWITEPRGIRRHH